MAKKTADERAAERVKKAKVLRSKTANRDAVICDVRDGSPPAPTGKGARCSVFAGGRTSEIRASTKTEPPYLDYPGRLRSVGGFSRAGDMTQESPIGELRLSHGLTRDALAKALHVSAKTVENWEKGHAPPGLKSISQIRRRFGTSWSVEIASEFARRRLAKTPSRREPAAIRQRAQVIMAGMGASGQQA